MYLISLTEREVRDERMWSSGYVIPDTYTLQGATNNAGTITRWLADNLYPDLKSDDSDNGKNIFEKMMNSAKAVPPGSNGLLVLPYFAGERSPISDPMAKGVFFGLGLHDTRDHIYRACLESVAYGLRQHLEIMEKLGASPRRLIAVGGGTKNPMWMKILADVCGRTMNSPVVNIGASYGDALIASIAAGLNGNFSDLRKIIRYESPYEPDEVVHRRYEEYYKIFSRLYPTTSELMHSLV